VPGLEQPAIVATTPVRVTRDVEKVLLGSARVTLKVK